MQCEFCPFDKKIELINSQCITKIWNSNVYAKYSSGRQAFDVQKYFKIQLDKYRHYVNPLGF